VTPRKAGLRILPAASLAIVLIGLLAGCGLKGPLYLPEKSGDVTVRPAPGTPAAEAPSTTAPPAGPSTSGSASPAPPGSAAPEAAEAPAAGPTGSEPAGTGRP
jgi:predicted small lipoprotein YifL